MRTLVVSDLHLGGRSGGDVLRRPGPLAEFCARLSDVDRLILLGDLIEFREGPEREAMEVARPVLGTIGRALRPDAQVVVVPGNHDHALIAPWLAARGRAAPPPPLGLHEDAGAVPSALGALVAEWLGAERTTFAYPGVWVRDDVYATHGHYLDRLTTLPTLERLASGAMTRVSGRVPVHGATPDDFERGLGPIYAWLHNVANQSLATGPDRGRRNPSTKAWVVLSGGGRRPLLGRALAALVPIAIAGVNRAGLGPVRSTLSSEELRLASLRAMGDVTTALGLRPSHVIFGHTHRAGPLPGDDHAEWTVAESGTRLINDGAWVDEPIFSVGGPENPYWAGRGVMVEDDAAPRLERLVTVLGHPPRTD